MFSLTNARRALKFDLKYDWKSVTVGQDEHWKFLAAVNPQILQERK